MFLCNSAGCKGDCGMARYEIVDELTELNDVVSPLFKTNNETEALTMLDDLRKKYEGTVN